MCGVFQRRRNIVRIPTEVKACRQQLPEHGPDNNVTGRRQAEEGGD